MVTKAVDIRQSMYPLRAVDRVCDIIDLLADVPAPVQAVIEQTMTRLEMSWYHALGEDVYGGLSHALERLQEVLDRQLSPRD